MKKLHCLFTKDGAQLTLGVAQSTFNKKLKHAEDLGVEIWKILGGIKLFDVDRIQYPEDYIECDQIKMSQDSKGQLSFEF